MSKIKTPKKVIITSLAKLVTYDRYKHRLLDESIRDEALNFYYQQLEYYKGMHSSTRYNEYAESYLIRKKELEKEIENFFYFINKQMLPIVNQIPVGEPIMAKEGISRSDGARAFLKK